MSQLTFPARVRSELHSVWGKYPRLALPLARHRTKNGIAAKRGTEIVIEGFPRSGNTFAVIAFQDAQPRSVEVAHHLHIPAQLLWATHVGIPAIVLIRRPVDAIVSLVIRQYGEDATDLAYRQYRRFYAPLLEVRKQLVVCTFDDLTEDFGAVIRRVNVQHDTSFTLFEHTPENVRRCFALVEQADQEDHGGSGVREETVARPSAERQPLMERLRPIVREHPERERAEELYRTFIDAP